MSIINQSAFSSGKFNLPVGQSTDLQAVIEEYEKEVIIKLFDYSLAKEIISFSSSATDRIKNLVNGTEYVDFSGKNKKFDGLKVIITAYVYQAYLHDISTSVQNVAVVSSNVENGVNVGYSGKISKAWGEIHLQERIMNEFMYVNSEDYPEYIYNKKLGSTNQFGL